jgi:poly-gamma-glutamate synthesis protein (capsule biosynthesis protein)
MKPRPAASPSLRTIPLLAIFAILLSACSRLESQSTSCAPPTGGQELSMFIAGDTIITQPWSHFDEPEFLRLIARIRGADAALANLETVIHEFKGYAQRHAGGLHLASPPTIAKELVWAGFDIVGHANNHTFDYGSIGVLENLENVRKAGLVLAGSGKDLQQARAPAYFRTPKGTVALVSTASTFTEYGRASPSRPDLRGRPGLNPLAVRWHSQFSLTRFFSVTFTIPSWAEIDKDDLKGNLDAIREARSQADVVALSIHAHRQGPWLEEFARQAVDAGADVIFGHGPHAVRGVEVYRCKPIFYSLGDFVFQYEQIERLPWESYAAYRLGDDAKPEDVQNAYSRFGTRSFPARRQAWEGIAAAVNFKGREVTAVRLVPMDLGFGKPLPIRGRPKPAGQELAKKIIGDVAEQSRGYGTAIEYVESENAGVVEIR